MIESDGGVPPQRPPYIDSELVRGGEDSETKNELPGIGSYLFQALVVGLFIGLLPTLTLVVWYPGIRVNPLLFMAVSFGITYGVAFALVEAIIIWICTYIARRRLHALTRAAIGAAVPYLAIEVWIVFSQRNNESISVRNYLDWIIFYSVVGAVCGLVIGSKRLGARS
jgi:hypothetical protein